MNTPEKQVIGTTISEKIRTGLTRPGVVFATAAIGFGLAGTAAAAADPTAVAQAASLSSASTGATQAGTQAASAQAGTQAQVMRDGEDGAERGDRERDKRSEEESTDDKQAKDDKAKDDKAKDDKRDGDDKGRPAWTSPMPRAKTTSCFGPRWGTAHKGLDLAEPENAPVNAAGTGTVLAEGWLYQGYGISVVVDHGDGHLTHYAHLNKTTVKPGSKVKAGDRIGFEGNTGDSTGPHLHFEVHKGMWKQVNPGPWMKERGVDLRC